MALKITYMFNKKLVNRNLMIDKLINGSCYAFNAFDEVVGMFMIHDKCG
jgi:hypothetical protein